MKVKRALAAVLICSVLLVTAGFIMYEQRAKAIANETSRYQQLENISAGYKERAAKSGIPDATRVPVLRPANEGSANIKPIEQMKGYIPENDYRDSAYYVAKETLTYEEFINKYTEFDLDPSISKDRVVNVTVTRYPKGFEHRKGFVKNAVITKVYDAETAEFIGSSIRSLDPDGMNFKMNNGR